MSGTMIKIVHIIVSFVMLITLIGVGGTGERDTTGVSQEPAAGYGMNVAASTQEPMTLDLSFPNGAPLLNQPVELRCVMNAYGASSNNVTVKFNLPDGIQLVSGNLSAQFGSMSKNDVKELKVVIKPTKVGNYTIAAIRSYVPQMRGLHPGPGVFKIYLSVSETSAEWKKYPLWVDKPINPWQFVQTKPGDVKPIPLTSEQKLTIERAAKGPRPQPPAISLDGTMKKTEKHNSIAVEGTLKYYTDTSPDDYRDNPTTAVVAKWFLVELVDTNGEHLQYGYTNDQGYFWIDGVNPTGGIIVKMWCYVKYEPSNYELRVVISDNPPPGLSWDVHSFAFDGFFVWPDDGQTHTVTELTLSPANGYEACWIKDDFDRAFRFTPTQPGPATAKWPDTSTPGPAHYHPQPGGQIHLWAGAEKSSDVVVHEYGHNVMYNVYNPNNPPNPYWPPGDCPTNHSIPSVSNLGCSWKEGWAVFFALAVNGDAEYRFSNGDPLDLEIRSWNEPDWADGDMVEGRVAGALLDLFDSNPDGFDKYWDGFTNIWDTLSNQTDGTFSEFYTAWGQRNHDKQRFLGCAYQNTIVYDTVPSLAEAVDNGLTWSTEGYANWFGEKFEYYYDGDAVQSGVIPNSQSTRIKTSVTGPGTLKFYWRVSSQANADFLRFYIDSVDQGNPISGTTGDWIQRQCSIGSGSHEVMWEYAKDGSGSSGCDCGWIDKVEWNPSGGTQRLMGADDVASPCCAAVPNYLVLSKFAATASGNVNTIKVKCYASGNVKVAIYADNSGNPGTLLNANNSGVSVVAGWNDIPISSTSITQGINYWIAYNSDAQCVYYAQVQGGVFFFNPLVYSANFPNPAPSCSSSPGYVNLVQGWGTVASSLSITTSSLPNGTVGTAYSQQLQASGGTPPYTWSLYSGSLPGGLSLNSSTGVISGTPTTSGTFNFTSQVTDSASSSATKPLSITINPSGSTQRLMGADDVASPCCAMTPNYLTLSKFTVTASGTVTIIKVKCYSSGQVKVAIYADNSGNPGTLLSSNNLGAIVAPGWTDIAIPSTPVTQGNSYWIAYNSTAQCVYYNGLPGGVFFYTSLPCSNDFPAQVPACSNTPNYVNLVQAWGTVGGMQRLIGADDVTSPCCAMTPNYLTLSKFNATASGSITFIKVKCYASGNVKVAIYAADGIDNKPGTLLNANNNGVSVVPGWNDVAISPTSVTQGVSYWIAYNSSVACVYYNGLSGGIFFYTQLDYSSNFPSPAPTSYSNPPNYVNLVQGWGN